MAENRHLFANIALFSCKNANLPNRTCFTRLPVSFPQAGSFLQCSGRGWPRPVWRRGPSARVKGDLWPDLYLGVTRKLDISRYAIQSRAIPLVARYPQDTWRRCDTQSLAEPLHCKRAFLAGQKGAIADPEKTSCERGIATPILRH